MMLTSHYNNINVMVRAFRLIGLLWLATAAHSVTSAPIINAKTYRVATEADDVVTRILFDAIAYQFRLEIDYVNYPSFDAILTAIEQGESDFAANNNTPATPPCGKIHSAGITMASTGMSPSLKPMALAQTTANTVVIRN